MKRLSLMMVAGLLAASATACFNDPVADLRGGPDRIQFSTSYIVMNVGDTQRVDIKVYDQQGGSLPFAAPTYASAAPTVADAEPFPDSVVVALPNNDYWKGIVIGKGPGFTKVAVNAGGLTDSISVLVFPLAFNGTLAPTTAAEGAEVTLTAPAGLSFRPETEVTVGGYTALLTAVPTATQLKFAATPVGAAQTVTLGNLTLAGQFNIASLDVATALTVTSADEPANDDPATAQAFTGPANVGDSVVVYGSITDGDDIDDFWKFTAGAAGNYTVKVYWPNDHIDIDIFVLNGTGGGFCVLDGCSAASGADPEVATVTLAAATAYQVLIELYDAHDEDTPHPYRMVVKRIS